MLSTLRKGASTWIAKIFIIILAASFGVFFFVADYFTGYGQNNVAEVGDVEIPAAEFDRQLRSQIRAISNRLGQLISLEQARAFGLDRQVLGNLITNAAVDSHARDMGLGVSDAAIRRKIFKSPIFLDESGHFSREKMLEILRNNDLNEALFIKQQRTGAIRDQLVLTLVGDMQVPRTMLDSLNHYENDKRVVEFFILPSSAIGKIKKPDDKQLQEFLDANKADYTAPEYRKIAFLSLSPKALEKKIKISEKDIRAEYEERIDQYSIPGKRHVRRMSFIDPAKARQAKKELDGGADFLAVAKKYHFKEKDTDLGYVDKTAIVDPDIAEKAFSMKKGEIAGPIRGNFSHTIIQVVDIKPSTATKKLSEVRDEIRKSLFADRATDEISRLHDEIEDQRAAGLSLEKIAKKLDLPYRVVDKVDRRGQGPDGRLIMKFPADPAFLQAVFESDVGADNEAVESRNGNVYWWFDVLAITPSRVKKLDEVRKDVLAGWQKRERQKAMSKLSNQILAKLRKGEKLSSMAKKYKAQLKRSKPFTRREEHDEVPASAVAQAFILPVGGVGSASLKGKPERIIFRLKKVIPASAPDKKTAKKLRKTLRSQLENDMVAQYVAALRQRYGVKVNQKVLSRILGGGNRQQ